MIGFHVNWYFTRPNRSKHNRIFCSLAFRYICRRIRARDFLTTSFSVSAILPVPASVRFAITSCRRSILLAATPCDSLLASSSGQMGKAFRRYKIQRRNQASDIFQPLPNAHTAATTRFRNRRSVMELSICEIKRVIRLRGSGRFSASTPSPG